MTQLGTNTQGGERPELRVVSDLSHIPAPPEATWVGEWHDTGRDCGHWIRMFTIRKWTVETSSRPIGVELSGVQLSDGSIRIRIWIDVDNDDLEAGEALMLAATLSRAADEQERIQGDRR
jgi:hypothetical protein